MSVLWSPEEEAAGPPSLLTRYLTAMKDVWQDSLLAFLWYAICLFYKQEEKIR